MLCIIQNPRARYNFIATVSVTPAWRSWRRPQNIWSPDDPPPVTCLFLCAACVGTSESSQAPEPVLSLVLSSAIDAGDVSARPEVAPTRWMPGVGQDVIAIGDLHGGFSSDDPKRFVSQG